MAIFVVVVDDYRLVDGHARVQVALKCVYADLLVEMNGDRSDR